MSGVAMTTKRCAETRAHYAHQWVNAPAGAFTGMTAYCPGGPDEGPAPGPCFAWHRMSRAHCGLDHGHAGAHVSDDGGTTIWVGDLS